MTHRIFFFALEMMKNLSNLSKPHLCHFWTNLQMLLGGISKGPSIVGTNIVNAFYHEKKEGHLLNISGPCMYGQQFFGLLFKKHQQWSLYPLLLKIYL